MFNVCFNVCMLVCSHDDIYAQRQTSKQVTFPFGILGQVWYLIV